MTLTPRQIKPRRFLTVAACVLATVGLAIAFLARPASVRASTGAPAGHRGCSERTLQGSYGGDLTGTSTDVGPSAGTVLETFRGDGTGTADVVLMTQTVGPLTFTGEPVTYTLNADCTGTLAAVRGGEVHHFAIVVTDSGRKIYQLRTDPGNALAGTLDRV
jgi:hypothetical protein